MRDAASFRDKAARPDDDIVANADMAEDNRAHADKDMAADFRRMDDAVMPDDDLIANDKMVMSCRMDGRVILDIGELADADRHEVPADGDAEPDARAFPDLDIAYDSGRRGHKHVLRNFWRFVFIRNDKCHKNPS